MRGEWYVVVMTPLNPQQPRSSSSGFIAGLTVGFGILQTDSWVAVRG